MAFKESCTTLNCISVESQTQYPGKNKPHKHNMIIFTVLIFLNSSM